MSAKKMVTKKPTKKKYVLVLRTCNSDMTSHGGFKWPKSGPVRCSDWDAKPECGGGLHGLLWGEGHGSLLNLGPVARWLVVRVLASEIVDIVGKVKFPRGVVVHCGDQKSATDYIIANGAAGRAVVGAVVIAGDRGTATAGRRGTATAGLYGTATAGSCGEIRIRWYDGNRYRLAVGYVGEDGIKPNVPYKVIDGKLVKADGQ